MPGADLPSLSSRDTERGFAVFPKGWHREGKREEQKHWASKDVKRIVRLTRSFHSSKDHEEKLKSSFTLVSPSSLSLSLFIYLCFFLAWIIYLRYASSLKFFTMIEFIIALPSQRVFSEPISNSHVPYAIQLIHVSYLATLRLGAIHLLLFLYINRFYTHTHTFLFIIF